MSRRARPLRLEFPGAVSHLTARGNAQGAIVLDEDDRDAFLACLGEVVSRFGWRGPASCLLENHEHLLSDTPEGKRSLGMRQLHGVYTQRFNRRHARVGPVLQGRYKAIMVERDRSLLEVCRYVVRNPIRAGLTKQIARYPWSSSPATLGLTACPAHAAPARFQGPVATSDAPGQRDASRGNSESVLGVWLWHGSNGKTCGCTLLDGE